MKSLLNVVAAAVFALCVLVQSAEADAGGVVFYAPFDGTADAAIGVDRTASPRDGEPQFEEGKRNKALLTGDDMAYLTFDAANLPAEEGSVEFWIKPIGWDAVSTDTFHVWLETDQADGNWFVFYKYFNDQTLRLIREKDSVVVERKVFPWEGWIHLAVTWSARGSTIYWNGQPSGTTKPVNPPKSYSGRMMVGDRGWHQDMARSNERTLLDEMYIYDRALEPEEVRWAFENAMLRAPGSDIPDGLVPAKVHARIFPSQNRIVAEVRHRLTADSLDSITGTAELLGPTPINAIPLEIHATTAQAVLPFDQLASGDYRLRVQFHDADGNLIDEAEDAFFCPRNEWLGNSIGISDVPPPPFTPMVASNDGFECLGREYALADTGLPEQIVANDMALFAKPVNVYASCEGRRIQWHAQPDSAGERNAVRATYSGNWRGSIPTAASMGYIGPGGVTTESGKALVNMTWRAEAEYDGMIRYDLTLTPAADPVAIDTLELRFPLNDDAATLINSSVLKDAIPTGNGVVYQTALASWWWVGNEDVGLAAFYESDEAWDRVDRPDGFRIERNGDAVEIVWSFVRSRWTLDKPWTFTFGMTATPVKSTAGLSGLPSRVMYSNPRYIDRPLSYSDEGVVDLVDNEAIREKIWSRYHVLWIGGPWTLYKLDWRVRPSALGVLPAAVDRLHEQSLLPIQYCLPREIPESVLEWRFWQAEWAGNQKVTWTNEAWDSTTCTPSWVDFVVWYMTNHREKYGFDGLYIDNGIPTPLINPDGGAGYMRDGVMRPTNAWFAVREIFKRLYTSIKQGEDEPTMIMSHGSDTLPVAYLGFMDNRLEGEQFQYHFRHMGMPPAEVISLDRWRAQLLSANLGSMCQLICYTSTRTRAMTSLLLLHDVGMWFQIPSNITDPQQQNLEAVHAMWTLQDSFGIQDAQFLPYWKNQDIIAGQTDTMKVTAWHKDDAGTMLIVANLRETAQSIDLTVDWDALTSGIPTQIVNAETGEPYHTDGRTLHIEVPGYDYIAVRAQ